jgi:hypothetical protein
LEERLENRKQKAKEIYVMLSEESQFIALAYMEGLKDGERNICKQYSLLPAEAPAPVRRRRKEKV